MTPDDPRHGEYAGAIAHWLKGERPCDLCARAETRYRKMRKLKHLRGEAVTYPALGTLRRIQALGALGWTGPQIAAESGSSLATIRSLAYHGSRTVHAKTAEAIAEAYERLCMVRPVGAYADRARSMAAKKRWAPPLSYDDIDDPNERPRWARDRSRATGNSCDEAVVLRILGGEYRLRATDAERREVIRRWDRLDPLTKRHGRSDEDFGKPSLAYLGRLTGWKIERYWKASA